MSADFLEYLFGLSIESRAFIELFNKISVGKRGTGDSYSSFCSSYVKVAFLFNYIFAIS